MLELPLVPTTGCRFPCPTWLVQLTRMPVEMMQYAWRTWTILANSCSKSTGIRLNPRTRGALSALAAPLLYVFITAPTRLDNGIQAWTHLFNIPLKLLVAHGQCVKQLLDTDCRPSGPWVWGFLDNLPIVIKHQPSPHLRSRVAGRNGDITGRERQVGQRLPGVGRHTLSHVCSLQTLRRDDDPLRQSKV